MAGRATMASWAKLQIFWWIEAARVWLLGIPQFFSNQQTLFLQPKDQRSRNLTIFHHGKKKQNLRLKINVSEIITTSKITSHHFTTKVAVKMANFWIVCVYIWWLGKRGVWKWFQKWKKERKYWKWFVHASRTERDFYKFAELTKVFTKSSQWFLRTGETKIGLYVF